MGISWLKKIGKGAQIAAEFVPQLQPYLALIKRFTPDAVDVRIDQASAKADEFAAVVIQGEVIGQALGLAGPDKLKAITPLLAQLVLKSDVLAGKKIEDPVLFQRGVASLGSGWADILNSVKGD